MIVPYAHVRNFSCANQGTLGEMMGLAQRVEAIFNTSYKPDGMNLGMNLGRAAGAGVNGLCICTCCRGGSAIRIS